MTTTTAVLRAGARPTTSLLRAGLPAVLLAAAATTTLAAAGRAAGTSLDMAGEPIPVLGFGVLTVVLGLVGALLMTTHLVAAAIVVPALARRLP